MRKGFTLIELLITLFIIAILLGTLLPRFYYFDQETKLEIAAQEVREAILETQSLALAPPTTSFGVEYYFIKFDTTTAPFQSYRIYEHKLDGTEFPYSPQRNLPQGITFNLSGSPSELKYYVEDRGRIRPAGSDLVIRLIQDSLSKNLRVIPQTGQVILE